MEQAAHQIRSMVQNMERLYQNQGSEKTPEQMQRMEQFQNRVQNMVQQMEQVQAALKEVAVP